jgi:hypothetical protein
MGVSIIRLYAMIDRSKFLIPDFSQLSEEAAVVNVEDTNIRL